MSTKTIFNELHLKIKSKEFSIGIVGLGYVGLPLAIEIAKQKTCLLTKGKLERTVFGYDIHDDVFANPLKKDFVTHL